MSILIHNDEVQDQPAVFKFSITSLQKDLKHLGHWSLLNLDVNII